MAERDASWTIQIHNSWGTEGPIDRLVDWAYRVSPTTEVNVEVVDLSATTLSWLLTSSNRFLRDGATKALVSLLDGRLEAARRIVDRFADVDDPYVLERVYAAVYGVSMRSRNSDEITKLALSVYDHVFAEETPPVHILLRDYARGAIERAVHLNPGLSIDIEKVRPPYRSDWPSIPSEKAIQELIERMGHSCSEGSARDSGWEAIRRSVLHWDFATYIIGTNSTDISRDWLALGIDEGKWRPAQERREELLSDFSSEERVALDTYESMRPKLIEILQSELWPTAQAENPLEDRLPIRDQLDEVFQQFLATLTDEHRSAWESLDEGRPGFSLKVIQRYVLSRVLDLGWTMDRFGSFDDLLDTIGNYNRRERKAERIGKKYQWIAYHEVLAYISDSLRVLHRSGEARQYEGPWQIGLRDIDPSVAFDLPFRRERESLVTGSAWWAPSTLADWNSDSSTRRWINYRRRPIRDERGICRYRDPASRRRTVGFAVTASSLSKSLIMRANSDMMSNAGSTGSAGWPAWFRNGCLAVSLIGSCPMDSGNQTCNCQFLSLLALTYFWANMVGVRLPISKWRLKTRGRWSGVSHRNQIPVRFNFWWRPIRCPVTATIVLLSLMLWRCVCRIENLPKHLN